MKRFSAHTILILLATACASPSKTPPSQTPSDFRLQEESGKIRAVYLSEPMDNSGNRSFSTSIKISRAILSALEPDQQLVFIGSRDGFSRLSLGLSPKTLSKLRHVQAQPYMWLQDLMEFGTSSSGPTAFMSYGNEALTETVKAVMNRTLIVNSDAVHGTVGGNLERWPGGVGVIGTSDFPSEHSLDDFVRQVFPKEKTVLRLPTEWLFIGHTDEVVKLASYRNTGDSCELAFIINSPKKALDVLKTDPKTPFLDELDLGETRTGEIETIREICKLGKLDCKSLRNEAAVRVFSPGGSQNKSLKAITQKQDEIKNQIVDTYRKLLPSCRVKWLEAPSLHLASLKGSQLEPRTGRSVFPSLTNGLLIGDRYIVADPGNPSFRKSFSDMMRLRSIEVVYVPLGKELFRGSSSDGHIHCMTQVLREN